MELSFVDFAKALSRWLKNARGGNASASQYYEGISNKSWTQLLDP